MTLRELVRAFLRRDATFAELRTEGNKPTLAELGTPWAEVYRGSGRLTGRLAEEPTRLENGDAAPGWAWIGYLTEQEFQAELVWGKHYQCHTPDWPGYECPHCREAGW